MNEVLQTTETIYAGGVPARLVVGASLVLVVVFCILMWREYRRSGSRAVFVAYGLRLVSLAIAGWMLAQPTSRSILEQTHRKTLAVFVDSSESMTVEDVASDGARPIPDRRIDQAVGVVEAAETSWIADLAGRARILRYGFDAAAMPVADRNWADLKKAVAAGHSTNLASAIEQVVRDRSSENVQAVVLLSDGGHNTGPDPVAAASSLQGVPVYIVPVGNPKPARDVIVQRAQAPRAVLQNDSIVIEAAVDVQGCEGEELLAQLVKDSQAIDEQHIRITSDSQTRRITFVRKAEQIGLERLTLRVEPVADEVNAANNETSVDVQVVHGKIPVLLVDQYPRWEFRFLRNLLRRDEQTELDYILQSPASSGRGAESVGVALPRSADEWERYRVIVLGDLRPDSLASEHQAGLVEYVAQRGGTVIVLAGERMPAAYAGQPLQPLLPVVAENSGPVAENVQVVLVTPEGADSTISQLTGDSQEDSRLWQAQFAGPFGGTVLNAYCRPKPNAHVLLQMIESASGRRGDGEPRALLCWHRFGRGKVIYVASPVTYLLRQRHSDLYHHRFWGQMLRWANARELPAGSQLVHISTDKSRYAIGEDVQVSVRLRQPDGEPVSAAEALVLASREGTTVGQAKLVADAASPGLYRGTLKGLPGGVLSVQAEGGQVRELLRQERLSEPAAAEVIIESPNSLEMQATRCNLGLLERVARATGGRVLSANELKDAVRETDFTPVRSRQVARQPLWNRWIYLVLLVSCLTCEWGLRRWIGLL